MGLTDIQTKKANTHYGRKGEIRPIESKSSAHQFLRQGHLDNVSVDGHTVNIPALLDENYHYEVGFQSLMSLLHALDARLDYGFITGKDKKQRAGRVCAIYEEKSCMTQPEYELWDFYFSVEGEQAMFKVVKGATIPSITYFGLEFGARGYAYKCKCNAPDCKRFIYYSEFDRRVKFKVDGMDIAE